MPSHSSLEAPSTAPTELHYHACWLALKEYLLTKNSHGKNELLNKMVELEITKHKEGLSK